MPKMVFFSTSDLADHLCLLDPVSLHMRFGYTAAPHAIRNYCQGIVSPGFILGCKLDGVPVAAAHVAIYDNEAELGISVLADHRRTKLAEKLIKEVIRILGGLDYKKINTVCLPENRPFISLLNKLKQEFPTLTYVLGDMTSERKAYIELG